MSEDEAPPGSQGRLLPVALVALLVAVLAEAFYLLVIYEDSTYPMAQQDRGGVPASSDTAPSSTAATDQSTPTPSQVGETRRGENADTTLLQTRSIKPPRDRRPGPGEEWFGIRARTCLRGDASPSGGLPWSSWAVVDATGQRYFASEPPWDDFPPQQLPTTGLQPGACNVGWVLIAVPTGSSARIEQVLFRPRTPEPAVWAV